MGVSPIFTQTVCAVDGASVCARQDVLAHDAPQGTIHYIEGSQGGQQGDPPETMRFVITTHPICGGSRDWTTKRQYMHSTTCAAYPHDLMVYIKHTLAVFAHACRTCRNFKQDADPDVRLTECKIYMSGVTGARARPPMTQSIQETSHPFSIFWRPTLTLQARSSRCWCANR